MRSLGLVPAFLLSLLAAPPVALGAADPNGYAAQYECRADGPRCDVDVAALGARTCDQIITSSMPWPSIDWSKDTICLEEGDHTWKGTLTVPDWANGSHTNYKVLRYYRSGDTNDDPWRQSSATQAKVERLVVRGDYWLVQRLTFPPVSSGLDKRVRAEVVAGSGDVKNVIFNRLLVEGAKASSYSYYGFSEDCSSSAYDTITVQNSVVRSFYGAGNRVEAIAIDLQCGSNLHAVNNEVYDWCSHAIQTGHNGGPTIPGVVIENNDFYLTSAAYGTDGRAAAENLVAIKNSGTAGNPTLVVKNRFWGARETDTARCGNGGGGGGVMINSPLSQPLSHTLVMNNVFMDSQYGSKAYPITEYNSVVGNIYYKIKRYHSIDPFGNTAPISSWYRKSEIYLNTIVDSDSSIHGHSELDVRCNAVIASGPRSNENPDGSYQADYNVFYGAPGFAFNDSGWLLERPLKTRTGSTPYQEGDIVRWSDISQCKSRDDAACFLYMAKQSGVTDSSSPTACKTLACTFSDGSLTWQAIRGPYVFWRKLKTGPEEAIIPYARPHVSAPEAFTCPADYMTRAGFGVDNAM